MKHKTNNKKQESNCYMLHATRHMNAGFTLVEMIVALFIFSIVMIVAATAVISMLDANRKAQATKTVMNNLNFSLDAMTRAIRVGGGYSCSATPGDALADCASGSEIFSFNDTDSAPVVPVTYKLATTVEGRGQIMRDREGGGFLPVTSPDVNVTTLKFYLENDGGQPRVLIIMRGTAGKTPRTEVAFNLQTLITQRFLER
ncbi:MAG: type II secretion system GspH family protein [Candidatus Campbellbacteria bacterium]|nr:type II secretion system GspH family protein [Candidatus Campbellbacteria bacterium]